jgi:hypothetical protein
MREEGEINFLTEVKQNSGKEFHVF